MCSKNTAPLTIDKAIKGQHDEMTSEVKRMALTYHDRNQMSDIVMKPSKSIFYMSTIIDDFITVTRRQTRSHLLDPPHSITRQTLLEGFYAGSL